MLRVVLVLVLLLAGGAAGWWYWLGPGAQPGASQTTPQRTVVVTPTLSPPTLATPRTEPPPMASVGGTPTATTEPSAQPTAGVLPTANALPVAAPSATGRALLRERRFVDAGRAFAAEARALHRRHTIQILVACSDETLDKTLQSVGADEWFIIPVLFKGRPCHRLCWGMYETPDAAGNAQRQLPAYFRSGGAMPRVVPLATILP